MASDEKYLWVFTYRFHEENRLWWAYFRDRQEAEGCIGRMMELFPCVEMKSLEERTGGLQFTSYYYHYRSSDQKYADRVSRRLARERDRQFFPLAPFASDYLSSFVVDIDNVSPCSGCEWPSPVPARQLPELSRPGQGGRRGFR